MTIGGIMAVITTILCVCNLLWILPGAFRGGGHAAPGHLLALALIIFGIIARQWGYMSEGTIGLIIGLCLLPYARWQRVLELRLINNDPEITMRGRKNDRK